MNRYTLVFIPLCAVLAHLGCAPTRGYDGPSRSAAETATVYFYSNSPISLSEMRVGSAQQGYFDLGLTVLPGEHALSASYSANDTDCGSGYTYGCVDVLYEGDCQGSIHVEAGHQYSVRAIGSGESAYLSITDKADDQVAGSGSCVERRTTYSSPKR